MYYYYLGILCLVASTLALPTLPSSSSSNEIKEKNGYHKTNDVDIHKVEVWSDQTGASYSENSDNEDWNENEIYEYTSDPNHDSKEVEDEEVGNEDEEIEEEENEDEEVEIEEADEQGSDIEKYSNIKKTVIIKWKVPKSFLLYSLIANMSPENRVPYPDGYLHPFRFPYVKNPSFVNY